MLPVIAVAVYPNIPLHSSVITIRMINNATPPIQMPTTTIPTSLMSIPVFFIN